VTVGRLVLAVALVLVTGCATAHDVFTNPTGNITVPRQEFINSYAVVKVLWKQLRENAELACASAPQGQVSACFGKLHDIDTRAKVLAIQIEAKILVPESQIDWGVVTGLLSAIIGLIP